MKLASLTVIVPCYNEAQTIESVLKRLIKLPFIKQIIVVNDGSTDSSGQIISRLSSNHKINPVTHPTNQGKGAAIRTAIPKIKSPLTAIQDADLEYDPKQLKLLLQACHNYPHPPQAVYGSRLLENPFPQNGYLTTLLGNHVITWFTNVFYHTHLTDSYTCYKLIPTPLLHSLQLQSKGFEIEAEITAKLARKNVRIQEVPIRYTPRTYSKGKKIKFKDFFLAIYTLIRYRF